MSGPCTIRSIFPGKTQCSWRPWVLWLSVTSVFWFMSVLYLFIWILNLTRGSGSKKAWLSEQATLSVYSATSSFILTWRTHLGKIKPFTSQLLAGLWWGMLNANAAIDKTDRNCAQPRRKGNWTWDSAVCKLLMSLETCNFMNEMMGKKAWLEWFWDGRMASSEWSVPANFPKEPSTKRVLNKALLQRASGLARTEQHLYCSFQKVKSELYIVWLGREWVMSRVNKLRFSYS